MIRAAALLMALAGPVMAAPCADHDAVRDGLAQAYGEVLVSLGQTRSNQPLMIEVYVNPTTGSWTIIQTDPAGVSCIAAAGDRWQVVPAGVPS